MPCHGVSTRRKQIGCTQMSGKRTQLTRRSQLCKMLSACDRLASMTNINPTSPSTKLDALHENNNTYAFPLMT
eukprot:4431747-Amphidinium_carterae.2